MQQQPKRRNKHQQKPEYKNLNPFKEMQKHYKLYQHVETDFSTLYEPKQFTKVDGYQIAYLPYPQGAVFVKGFNSPETVEEIAAQCLNVYCYKPFRTNLNSRDELYKEEKEQSQETTNIKQQAKTEQKWQNQAGKGYYFNDKIRWANVGLQYDWTERKYPQMKTSIPQDVSKLCDRANRLFNILKQDKKNYYPESAIINYYGEKDYMTGHLDDAQVDQQSPIYSFSFGLSCIFLIGGPTKETKPISVRLNSGDLLIMGGQSRKCYHGVPRIISKSYQPDHQTKIQIQPEWSNNQQSIQNYLSTHRININVRQVFPTTD